MGRKVEVFYREGVSQIEVFHGIENASDAQRMLEMSQNAGEWTRRMQTEKRSEWESGPLRAVYEDGKLAVTFAQAAQQKRTTLRRKRTRCRS